MAYNPNQPRDSRGRWTKVFVAKDPDKWFEDKKGKPIGDMECVKAVQDAIPTIGTTKHWAPGTAISEKPELANGTAIATFVYDKKAGRYVYSGHAAIFVKYDTNGIWVRDQWAARYDGKGNLKRKEQRLHERLIQFNPKKSRQNNAGAYSTVIKE